MRTVVILFLLTLSSGAAAQSSLPRCTGPSSTWNNCFGALPHPVFSPNCDERRYVGGFRGGKAHGEGIWYDCGRAVGQSGRWEADRLVQAYPLDIRKFPFHLPDHTSTLTEASTSVPDPLHAERDRLNTEAGAARSRQRDLEARLATEARERERLVAEARERERERDRQLAEIEAERKRRQELEARLAAASVAVAASPAREPMAAPAQRLEQAPSLIGRRVALVVGNARYADRPLANPVNDAKLMSETLRGLGFEVQMATDVDRRDLLAAVRAFEARAREADVALFYFAGHGAQVGGNNYLIPVNAPIRSDHDLPDEALEASSVLRRIEDIRAKVALVILDACRDNPFPGSQRSAVRGLARMNAPTGTIVAYATAPGSTADDGAGVNGVYTGVLARRLRTPGLDIKEVFDQTAQEVERLTQGRQRPREDIGLRGRFVLLEAGSVPPSQSLDVENRFWDSAVKISNRDAYEAYLARFPNGQYAALARAAIGRLGVSNNAR